MRAGAARALVNPSSSSSQQNTGSDLERVEQQVAEEADEAQHGAFRDGLIDDEGEEDGVNPDPPCQRCDLTPANGQIDVEVLPLAEHGDDEQAVQTPGPCLLPALGHFEHFEHFER
ncbi:hypothetical protein EYF80_018757 [Liparis tanakae]|uniref:Uncharacterized protein n=1 Tax=Liparis tanakae TaxID=230148 RepID=A0A4Z2HZE4_9TELE|nr:hypothetical protein EYF80_018757 [Liparis tanakae]